MDDTVSELEFSKDDRKKRNDLDRGSEPGGRKMECQISGVGSPRSLDPMGAAPKESQLDRTLEVGAPPTNLYGWGRRLQALWEKGYNAAYPCRIHFFLNL